MSDAGSASDDDGGFVKVKNAADVQRLRLERLMKNPEKPVHIPDAPKDKAPPAPAEFVRFYMGSSAGAGSGEFHIYRNLRRKEQNRQRHIDEQAKKDEMQEEFQKEREKIMVGETQKRNKKRAKRLKKREKQLNKKLKKSSEQKSAKDTSDEESTSDSDSEQPTTAKDVSTTDPKVAETNAPESVKPESHIMQSSDQNPPNPQSTDLSTDHSA